MFRATRPPTLPLVNTRNPRLFFKTLENIFQNGGKCVFLDQNGEKTYYFLQFLDLTIKKKFFFYPLLLWVFVVCSACYALLHIRGHSHSPPLICHYVSYLISTFTETTPGHMAPTRECTHFDQSCHKSMWASDYIFFRHAKLADTFSLLCVGGGHWNWSHKEFVESERWTPDLRIESPSS